MMTEVMEGSLYESIGGADAVDAAVDLFYEKVLADERISEYFETVKYGPSAQQAEGIPDFCIWRTK